MLIVDVILPHEFRIKKHFAISGKGIDQVQLNKTIIFLIASNFAYFTIF